MGLRTATTALFLAFVSAATPDVRAHQGMHVHVRVHAEAAAMSTNTSTNSSAASSGNATLDSTATDLLDPVGKELAIGEWVALNPENYTIADPCKAQEWTVKQTKGASLQLHFAAIATAGHKIVVSAPNGSFAQEFSSESVLHDVTTTAILGSSAKIAYQPSSTGGGCDASQPRPSFELDKVTVLYPQVKKEAICGKDTSKNAKCYDGDMYKKSKAVLMIARGTPDNKFNVCSAWLWGNQGLIVTNNHCIKDSSELKKATFMFQTEIACSAQCTFQTCKVAYALLGLFDDVRLLKTNSVLDYSVLKIVNKNKAADAVRQFGYLKLQRAPAKVGDRIYIPQHPRGENKRIAASDNDAGSNTATITATNFKLTFGGSSSVDLLKYAADTDHGSSGSPVISRATNAVVGLHRAAGSGCNNAATPADVLIDEFEMYLAGSDAVLG